MMSSSATSIRQPAVLDRAASLAASLTSVAVRPLQVLIAAPAWLFLATLTLILLRVARRATDAFSSLCVFGIASMLFTHIVENVGMTVNLMPITGIPLPFFSYGGSFLLTCSIAVGLCLRVAWESRLSGYTER